tara:strand:- start:104 stop:967 length:864 start_codon:yes stop_codon:yes gene_type:complete
MKDKPKEILMILQPRAIPEAIDSLNKLDIEKVWFRGYTEMELETVLNDFIKNTDYDYYWIISDDVVVDNKPLEVLRSKLYEGEVVTGYCKLHQASELVNICENMWEYGLPIEKVYQLHAQILTQGIASFIEEKYYEEHREYYDGQNENKDFLHWKHRVQYLNLNENTLLSFGEVQNKGDNYFETLFTGWAFTGMARDVWLNYPFQTSWIGNGTDAQFVMRYLESSPENKIYTHKDSYFIHLKEKETKNNPYLKRNWLVGEEEPVVHFGDGKLLRDEIETEHIYPKKD